MIKTLKAVLDRITNTQGDIYITSHYGPDHDSIASIAVLHELVSMLMPYKKVIVLLDQKLPKERFTSFPLTYRDKVMSMSDGVTVGDSDLLIVVDAHQLDRCLNHPESLQLEIYDYDNVIALDHHEFNSNTYIKKIFISRDFSSAAELMYHLGEEAEKIGLIEKGKFKQNEIVAEMTQVGILSDTDRGMYGLGPDTYRVMYECRNIKPLNVERLYKHLVKVPFGTYQALSEMLPFVEMRDDCVYAIVDYDMENDYMDRKEDIRAARAVFLEFLNRQTVGAEWSWIAREHAPGKWRVSFRSMNDGPSVLEKVTKMGGGGVHSAGSCEILAESKEELVEKVFEL